MPETDSAARDLLAYADELDASRAAQVGGAFTDIPEADAFLKSSSNAFLLGVLFTQGITAERAWAGPYLLRERLGHLDVRRLAAEPEAVAEAVALAPALHRFKHTLPRWISAAATRLLECYGGDASRVWEGCPPAVEVMERLISFPGIGRKKAAMAVEILARHFSVPFSDLSGGTVAYDVHVRRVFMRTGLSDTDSIEAIEAAAARISPDAPGRVDLAAWLVGRTWCRPAVPACEHCRLFAGCPRLTGRSVEGVGARRAR